MSLKCVYFFEMGDQGWSEVYHSVGADPVEGIKTLPQPGVKPVGGQTPGDLMARRLTCLHPNAAITHVRISVNEKPFIYDSLSIPAKYGTGLFKIGGGVPNPPAEVFTALLIEVIGKIGGSTPIHQRHYWHGIPEVLVGPDHALVVADSFKTPFDDFAATLTGAVVVGTPWILRTRQGERKTVPIGSFEVADDCLSATTYPIPPDVNVGDTGPWIIRGLKAPAGWNGTHPGQVVSMAGIPGGLAIVLGPNRTHRPSGPKMTVPHGTIEKFVPNEISMLGIRMVKLVEHKVGRPFGLFRGRRSGV